MEEKQLRVNHADGKVLSGTYTVIGGVITVTAENGRQLRTQLGSVPAGDGREDAVARAGTAKAALSCGQG